MVELIIGYMRNRKSACISYKGVVGIFDDIYLWYYKALDKFIIRCLRFKFYPLDLVSYLSVKIFFKRMELWVVTLFIDWRHLVDICLLKSNVSSKNLIFKVILVMPFRI